MCCFGLQRSFVCSCSYSQDRIVKDVIAFEASSFMAVTEKLQLDLHEPPMSQVSVACIKRSKIYAYMYRRKTNNNKGAYQHQSCTRDGEQEAIDQTFATRWSTEHNGVPYWILAA